MNEQWNDALEQVEDGYLQEAARYRRRQYWPGVAAAAAAVLVVTAVWSVFKPQTPPEVSTDVAGKGSMPMTDPPDQAAPGSAAWEGIWDSLLGGRGEPDNGSEESPVTYRVSITDDRPLVNKLKSGYAAGEEVTVQLPTLTEHYYVLYVNGSEQPMDIEASDLMYTFFTFSMPEEDVLIEIEDRWVDIPAAP